MSSDKFTLDKAPLAESHVDQITRAKPSAIKPTFGKRFIPTRMAMNTNTNALTLGQRLFPESAMSFLFTKPATLNRELGPGGVDLKDMGIPGRVNLVEALDDFEQEADRASDHLDENNEYIEIPTINAADYNKDNKHNAKFEIKMDDEMAGDLEAAIQDEGFHTRAEAKRRATAEKRAKVKNWMEGIPMETDFTSPITHAAPKETTPIAPLSMGGVELNADDVAALSTPGIWMHKILGITNGNASGAQN